MAIDKEGDDDLGREKKLDDLPKEPAEGLVDSDDRSSDYAEAAAQSAARGTRAQSASRNNSENINTNLKFEKRLHELAQGPLDESKGAPPPAESAPKTYDNSVLAKFASLPPHPTVHEVVGHINKEFGVEFNDRQVLQVAKQRNAVLRINGVVRIRMGSMHQSLAGLLDSIADKYTKSSHAKRLSQFRSGIVRKSLIKSATESLVLQEPSGVQRSAEELREVQLTRLLTDVNSQINDKNNALNTMVEGQSRSLIDKFKDTTELTTFIANLMLNTLKADRKK